MVDVRTALFNERRVELPWEDESDARARVGALELRRTPAELEALLARVRRTGSFEDAVGWLDTAGLGMPRLLYEGALLIYRDSPLLSWEDCLTLARLMSWSYPQFQAWNIRL